MSPCETVTTHDSKRAVYFCSFCWEKGENMHEPWHDLGTSSSAVAYPFMTMKRKMSMNTVV
jgi:hypothetical protein